MNSLKISVLIPVKNSFIHFFTSLLFLIFLGLSSQVKSQNFYISGGSNYSTALCSNGKLLVWGKNDAGQLGDATASASSNSPLELQVGFNIKQVDAGSGAFGIAVACDGFVYTWGSNEHGNIGDGTVGGTKLPTKVVGPDGGFLEGVSYVNASTNCSFAILEATGEVVAWGANQKGQLGNGTLVASPTPVYVKTSGGANLTNAIQVEGGDDNGYALVDPDGDGVGTVYSWGASTGTYGGLGMLGRDSGATGETSTIALPVLKDDGTPLDNIVSISGGDVHSLAIDANGNVWSWGNNAWMGQTGSGQNGVNTYRASKVLAGETGGNGSIYLEDVKGVAAGQSYSIAVLGSGEVVVWGGIVPQPGEGDFLNVKSLTPIYLKDGAGSNITGIKSVSDGDYWAFLIGEDGKLLSVGYDPNGELGLGTTGGTSVPQDLLTDCTVKEPCPIADLGADIAKCASDEIILLSGETSESYTYEWFKGTEKVYGGVGKEFSSYTTKDFGTFKVIITSTAFNTCNLPCEPSEDEIVIEQIPAPETPTAIYCEGTVMVNYAGFENGKYAWFTEQVGGTELGTPPNPTTFPVDGLTVSGKDAEGNDMYTAYIEDLGTFKGKVGPSQSEFSGTVGGREPNQADNKETKLSFDASTDFILDSMTIGYVSNGCTGLKTVVINIKESDGTIIGSASAVVPCREGSNPAFRKVGLGIKVPKGVGYTIDAAGTSPNFAIAWYTDGPANWTDAAVAEVGGNKVIDNVSNFFTPDYGQWSSPAFFDWVVKSPTHYPCGRIPVDSIKFECPPCQKPVTFNITPVTGRAMCTAGTDGITFSIEDTLNIQNPSLAGESPAYYYYDWYKLDDNGDEGVSLNNTNTFTITPELGSGDYLVRLTHKNRLPACQLDSIITILPIPGIDPGSIGNDSVFCFNAELTPVISVQQASGGTGSFANPPTLPTYEWEQSSDSLSWTIIAGENDENLTVSDLAGISYYRRKAANGTGECDVAYTNAIKYVRSSEITGGKIGPNPLDPICNNIVPGVFINLDSARNGIESDYSRFTFEWYRATGTDMVFDLVSDDANAGLTYGPGERLPESSDTVTYLYFRKVIDNKCGAAYSDTLQLVSYPVVSPEIELTNPGPICQLAKDTVFATVVNGGNTPQYEWSYNNGAFVPSLNNYFTIEEEWTIPATVRVRVIPSTEICTSGPETDSVIFEPTAKQTPEVELFGVTELCSVNIGENTPVANFVFNALGKPADDANRYQYSINGVQENFSGDTLKTQLKDGDVVSVILESQSECALSPFSEPFEIKAKVIETPDAVLNKTEPICNGEKTSISVEGGKAGSTYEWFYNEEKIGGANPVIEVSDSGNYHVVVTNEGKCADTSDVQNLKVESPDVKLDKNELELEFNKPDSIIATINYPFWRLNWSPNDSIFVVDTLNNNRISFVVNPDKGKNYTFILRSPLGCLDSQIVKVRVFKPIRVPNVFTPNGDGVNDTWTIAGLETYPDVDVKVFNRWGNIVFQSTGYMEVNEWKGEKNGQQVPVGTYYYVIDPKHPAAGGIYTGNVTVVK